MRDDTFGSMKTTPGLAILCIYSVCQMDLMFAVPCLVVVGGYWMYVDGRFMQSEIRSMG